MGKGSGMKGAPFTAFARDGHEIPKQRQSDFDFECDLLQVNVRRVNELLLMSLRGELAIFARGTPHRNQPAFRACARLGDDIKKDINTFFSDLTKFGLHDDAISELWVLAPEFTTDKELNYVRDRLYKAGVKQTRPVYCGYGRPENTISLIGTYTVSFAHDSEFPEVVCTTPGFLEGPEAAGGILS